MKLDITIKTAYTALFANKVRTFLTMLGVIIGVFAVVSLVSLVRGVQNYVTDQFNSLGTNLIFVSPGKAGIDQDPALAFTNNKLSEKHVDLINSFAKDQIDGISPLITVGRSVAYKTKRYYATITGVNNKFYEIGNVELSSGRNFTQSEEDSKSRVVILGSKAKDELFGRIDPIEKSVKIDNRSFLVVGVMETKGADFDEQVLIPYTTVKTELNVDVFSYLYIKLKDSVDIYEGSKKIELVLLKDMKKDDFTILNQKDLLNSVQQILSILSVGLGAVAGISLLVGGIGIMNIMLVAVTERTREVGLRKAVGATPANIGTQFLIESIMLSFSGGLIGLFFGFLTTLIARQFLRAEVPVWAILLSFGFSAAVGLIFGTYPAYKASKKDPIEALRYE